jgi:hypothetical protein
MALFCRRELCRSTQDIDIVIEATPPKLRAFVEIMPSNGNYRPSKDGVSEASCRCHRKWLQCNY